MSNFYDKLKFPALFSHLSSTEKSAENFNLLSKFSHGSSSYYDLPDLPLNNKWICHVTKSNFDLFFQGTWEEWLLVFDIASIINIIGCVAYILIGSSDLEPWAKEDHEDENEETKYFTKI